jgi:hypothetical protein
VALEDGGIVMIKKAFACFIAICMFLTVLGVTVTAAPAQRFTLKVQPAEDINLDFDHYKVTVIRGWVSAKDSFFKSVLSDKTKLVVSIEEEIGFFDKDKLNLSSLFENTDIKKNTNHPWGQNLLVLNNIAADADSKLNFRLAIHREDRISQIFQGLKASEADLGTDVLSAPWIGYAKAVGNIFNTLFGADQTSIPFSWTGNIKLADVMSSPKIMFGHYIILLAPNKSGDTFPLEANATKLSYDEGSQQLKYSDPPYNGTSITDRSFLVLKVSKAEGYNIPQLLFESSAPWAVLAVAQFLVIPTNDAKNVDQLSTLATNLKTQLENEIELLKREHRFSKYDRAVALRSFAVHSKDEISKKCTAVQVGIAQCPVGELQQLIDQIGSTFGLAGDKKFIDKLSVDSDRILRQMLEMNSQRTKLK